MNAFGRSAHEQREHDRLRYPGTDTLINKFDLRDPAVLDVAERMAVHERLRDGLPEAARSMSPAGIAAIHRYVLQDVYSWAGEHRRYTTGRGQAPFARPEFIAPELDRLFERIDSENALRGLDPQAFAARAAAHVNDLNAIHPFVDGNGRAQRIWLRALGEQAGYAATLRQGDAAAWNAASREGFYRSNDPMAAFIAARLAPLREQTQDKDRARDALMARYERSLAQQQAGRSNENAHDQADDD